MYLLTQVSEDRVQVICKLSTQVNKGRVQVRLEPGSTRTGYTLQQGKPVFKAGKLLTKIFKFYSQENTRSNRGNQFFRLELEI